MTSGRNLNPASRFSSRALLAWLAFAVAAACVALASPASAADFVTPPGQNLGVQEDLLRERVTRIAKDLVGDKLVSVVANIAYLRLDSSAAAAAGDRIKLPGLNNYVSTAGNLQVLPEYVRLREVVVVVSDELAGKTGAVGRDIRTQAELDPSKGDRVEVVTAANAGKRPEQANEPAADAAPKQIAAPALPDIAKDNYVAPRPQTSEGDTLREAKASLFLINARSAYFRGDYNTALDQIMQSINAKPDNAQAYLMLGSLYYAMNWKNLALKYWEKALAQDPGNRELEQLVIQLRTAQN
jgi:hypothetical protein